MAAERTRKIPGPASARDAPVRGLEATKASGVLHQSDDPVPRLLTSFGTRLLRTLKPSLPPLVLWVGCGERIPLELFRVGYLAKKSAEGR